MVQFHGFKFTILPAWVKRFDLLFSCQPGPPAPSHPDRDTGRPETNDRAEAPRFPLFDREPFRPVTGFFPDSPTNVVVNGAVGPSSPTQKTMSETETPAPLPTSPLDASGPGELIASQTLCVWRSAALNLEPLASASTHRGPLQPGPRSRTLQRLRGEVVLRCHRQLLRPVLVRRLFREQQPVYVWADMQRKVCQNLTHLDKRVLDHNET